MSSIYLWYTTRATGLVSLVLLTAVVLLGLLAAGRSKGTQPAFARVDLHRRVSALAAVFLGIHAITAVVDSFVNVGAASIVVPLASSYKTGWVALGTVGADLFLAIGISSLFRSRIPARLWRGIYWLAYLSWPLAVAHSLGMGTDMRLDWVLGLVAVCVAAVAGVSSWRAYTAMRARAQFPLTMIAARRSLRVTAQEHR